MVSKEAFNAVHNTKTVGTYVIKSIQTLYPWMILLHEIKQIQYFFLG